MKKVFAHYQFSAIKHFNYLAKPNLR